VGHPQNRAERRHHAARVRSRTRERVINHWLWRDSGEVFGLTELTTMWSEWAEHFIPRAAVHSRRDPLWDDDVWGNGRFRWSRPVSELRRLDP